MSSMTQQIHQAQPQAHDPESKQTPEPLPTTIRDERGLISANKDKNNGNEKIVIVTVKGTQKQQNNQRDVITHHADAPDTSHGEQSWYQDLD